MYTTKGKTSTANSASAAKIANMNSLKARLRKISEDHLESSLLKGSKKQQKQFERLTKEEKREWRETLQRRLSSVRASYVRTALAGYRIRGKTKYRLGRLTALESSLIDAFCMADDEVEYQSGGVAAGLAAAATAAAAVYVGSTATARINDVHESMRVKMNDLHIAAQDVASKGANVLESGTSLLDSVKSAFNKFVSEVKRFGSFVWKVMLAATVAWLCVKYAKCVPLVGILVGLATSVAPEIATYLKQHTTVQVQSGCSGAANFLAMILACWVPGKDFKNISGEFLRRMTYFPRATEGIEKFLDKCCKFLEEFINFVFRRGEDNAFRFAARSDAFTKWREQAVLHLKHLATIPNMPLDELQKIRAHYLEGFGFYQVLATVESKRDLAIWMEKLALAIRPHEGCLSAMNNVRAMPYFLMLGGGSGKGKTSLVRYFASVCLLLSGVVSAKNALANMWQKGTTEYWNGYVGQACLVMDDAFQVKAKPGDSDSEAMQLIRAVGNWSYPLNFADLESKGKYYLNTPLIIGTTNCKNIAAEWAPYITEPMALVRRFQGSYWVDVHEDYATDGKFDYEKMTQLVNERVAAAIKKKAEGHVFSKDEILDLIPWDAWILKHHSFDSSATPSVVDEGGLRRLVQEVADIIRSRASKNAQEVDDLQKMLDLLEDTPEFVQQQAGVGLADSMFSGMDTIPEHEADISTDDQDSTFSDDETMHDANRFATHRQAESDPLGTQSWVNDLKSRYGTSEIDSLGPCVWAEEVKEQRSIYRKMREDLESFVKNLMGNFGLNIPSVLAVLAGGAALAMVLKLAFSLLKGAATALTSVATFVMSFLGIPQQESEAVEQSNVGNASQHTRKDTKFKFATTDDVWANIPEMQVGVPPQKGAFDKVYRNTKKMVLTTESGEEIPMGQIIGLASDVYIYPKHFGKVLKQHMRGTLSLYAPFGPDVIKMEVSHFLSLPRLDVDGFDITGVRFGRSGLKLCKSVIPLFLKSSEVSSLLRGSNVPVRVDVCEYQKVDGKPTVSRTVHTSPTCEYMKGGVSASDGKLDGVMKYRAPTVAGDCGAPVMVSENRHYGGRCVMGFHSAGKAAPALREGYGTIVTQECALAVWNSLATYNDLIDSNSEIKEGVEPTPRDRVFPLSDEEELQFQSTGLLCGSFTPIGKLENPVSMGTVSKIIPSVMQEEEVYGPPLSRPAILRPTLRDGALVYPMVRGLEAYQSEFIIRDPASLTPVVRHAMKPHWEATIHHPRDLLSFEDAIQPPEHWKLKPLNRKTSPGFKYRDEVTPVKPGKTWALGHEGDITWDSQGLARVRNDVEDLIAKAKVGTRSVHLCIDFLKDELRTNAKVEAVKTRVISGTPMDYTIAVRMYFGSYMAATFDTYVQNGMAPGLNHYTEWGLLADALLAKGNKMFDGDFSRFDASEQPWVHEGLLGYINRWYKEGNSWTEEDDRVRCILWLDLVHSRHVTGLSNKLDLVVQWNKSLPSGHPLTTIVNSMYSLVTMTGCYVHLVGSYDMWDHAYVCTFGDDNVASVDDTVCDVFNQVTVAKCMKELFQLDYTAGNKGDELVEYTDISNITFLKRSFKPDEVEEGLIHKTPFVGWVAPLDYNSFLYEGYWYKNARDPYGDLERRLNHMLCELALHSEEDWQRYAEPAISWACKKGIKFEYYTREECRHYVKTRFDVWF